MFQLHVACACGYVEVARYLLQSHISPDLPDRDGWLPIHVAVCWGQVSHIDYATPNPITQRPRLGSLPMCLIDEMATNPTPHSNASRVVFSLEICRRLVIPPAQHPAPSVFLNYSPRRNSYQRCQINTSSHPQTQHRPFHRHLCTTPNLMLGMKFIGRLESLLRLKGTQGQATNIRVTVTWDSS